MDLIGGGPRSTFPGSDPDETVLDSLQFNDELRQLMTLPPENANSFTALLELPAPQAMELLHSTHSGAPGDDINLFHSFNDSLRLPGDNSSATSNSSANLEKVKNEPAETDSSQQLVSDTKRKEREKRVKGKGSVKKTKSMSNEDAEKLPYVHVRARRGQATDSHSLAERARREKINARMKLLQELVPGCNKISGTALVLDEIINHVQSLQRQVEFLSMRLAAVNPRVDFNLDGVLAAESGSLMDSNFGGMAMPMMWPGNRQHAQQQWPFDVFNQQVWGREEDSSNFLTPDISLLSYDSATLHSNQVKMEL